MKTEFTKDGRGDFKAGFVVGVISIFIIYFFIISDSDQRLINEIGRGEKEVVVSSMDINGNDTIFNYTLKPVE